MKISSLAALLIIQLICATIFEIIFIIPIKYRPLRLVVKFIRALSSHGVWIHECRQIYLGVPLHFLGSLVGGHFIPRTPATHGLRITQCREHRDGVPTAPNGSRTGSLVPGTSSTHGVWITQRREHLNGVLTTLSGLCAQGALYVFPTLYSHNGGIAHTRQCCHCVGMIAHSSETKSLNFHRAASAHGKRIAQSD